MNNIEKYIREDEKKDIIIKIIGEIESTGETNADNQVYENLKFVDDLICEILDSICQNARYDGFEGSCLEIKEKSIKILDFCFEMITNTYTDIVAEEREHTIGGTK